MSLARHPFWLDGGYDREEVEACRFHPAHRWWVFKVGEVIDCERSGRDPNEWMVICRGCFVPRCGHVEHEANPCMEPRHHVGPHLPARTAA